MEGSQLGSCTKSLEARQREGGSSVALSKVEGSSFGVWLKMSRRYTIISVALEAMTHFDSAGDFPAVIPAV